jgi:hypothetical protein
MSTIKISQLPVIGVEIANTSNTILLGVDLLNDYTGQLSATSLASGLYSNNPLAVGNNNILFPNTVAQFSGNVASYMQINQQNFNSVGTSDFIITADTGTNTGGFLDLGINNSQWNAAAVGQTSQYPLDGYLVVNGPGSISTGNLVIGTATPGTNLVFMIGGYYANNIPAVMTANGLVMNTATHLTFADGTVLASANTTTLVAVFNQANATNVYATSGYSQANIATTLAQAAYNQANTAGANTVYLLGIESTQNTSISAAFNEANTANTLATSAFNLAFNSNANTIYTQGVDLTQNTNIQLAWNQANNTLGVDSTQNTNIQLAWNEANTALQNTSTITVNNSIVVPGNLTIYGTETRYGNTVVNGNTTWNGSVTANGSFTANVVNANIVNAGNTFINNGIVTTANVTANALVSNTHINYGTITGNTVVSNTFVYGSATEAPVVTQLTSRSTSVTANGTSGQIIGYSGAAWTHQTGYVFTVNNSSVLHNTDIIFVSVQSSNCPLPQVSVANTRVGSFDVCIYNAAAPGNDASYTMNVNFGIIRVGS